MIQLGFFLIGVSLFSATKGAWPASILLLFCGAWLIRSLV